MTNTIQYNFKVDKDVVAAFDFSAIKMVALEDAIVGFEKYAKENNIGKINKDKITVEKQEYDDFYIISHTLSI